MSDNTELKTEPHDEPLCVLRYRGSRKFLLTIFSFFGSIFFGIFALAPIGGPIFYPVKTLLFGFMTILVVLRLIQLNYFKEIRLYNEKIVQVWRGGTTEVFLANAGLKCAQTRLGNIKIIFDQEAKIYSGIRFPFFFWKTVFYEEPWADPEDVRKINQLLADLSGRKVQDLEWSHDKLIKVGNVREDDHELFNESANFGLFLVLFYLALAVGIIFFFVLKTR
jgi:hypothetical protein